MITKASDNSSNERLLRGRRAEEARRSIDVREQMPEPRRSPVDADCCGARRSANRGLRASRDAVSAFCVLARSQHVTNATDASQQFWYPVLPGIHRFASSTHQHHRHSWCDYFAGNSVVLCGFGDIGTPPDLSKSNRAGRTRPPSTEGGSAERSRGPGSRVDRFVGRYEDDVDNDSTISTRRRWARPEDRAPDRGSRVSAQ